MTTTGGSLSGLSEELESNVAVGTGLVSCLVNEWNVLAKIILEPQKITRFGSFELF